VRASATREKRGVATHWGQQALETCAARVALVQRRVPVAHRGAVRPAPLDVSSRSPRAAPPPPPARTTTAAKAAATPAGCAATETAPASPCTRWERARKGVAEGHVLE
jgi:hypothetical protein